MNKLEKLKKALGKKAKLNEPMSKYTTLKIGGSAALFTEARTNRELIFTIKQAARFKVPYFLMAGGSNLLVNDEGFSGVVIHNVSDGIRLVGNKVKVKLGTTLQELVDFLIERGLQGMEAMAGIPGSVGGAIYGNAGAYGQEISDCLVRIKVFNGKDIDWISKQNCEFEYRESVFKKNQFLILEAEFEFKSGDPRKLKRKGKEIIEVRKKKYPDGLKSPGSFFKNVLVKDVPVEAMKIIPEDKIMFGKVPSGYLLEAVGAKGKERGKIKIADYHANLFLNRGGGKALDFYHLARFYRKKVKEKFGIELEPEVQLVGFKTKEIF